jgi:hypothetical protein
MGCRRLPRPGLCVSPESNGRPALPAWAETLRQKYLAGEASVFVLYRNVFDRYQVGERYYTLLPFLSEVLLKDNKQHIFELSIDRGVRVIQGGSAEEKAELYRHLEGKGLTGIFESLERQMREQRSSALLIPYAGTSSPRRSCTSSRWRNAVPSRRCIAGRLTSSLPIATTWSSWSANRWPMSARHC